MDGWEWTVDGAMVKAVTLGLPLFDVIVHYWDRPPAPANHVTPLAAVASPFQIYRFGSSRRDVPMRSPKS